MAARVKGGCTRGGSQVEVAVAVRLATEALGIASKSQAFGGDVHVANVGRFGTGDWPWVA